MPIPLIASGAMTAAGTAFSSGAQAQLVAAQNTPQQPGVPAIPMLENIRIFIVFSSSGGGSAVSFQQYIWFNNTWQTMQNPGILQALGSSQNDIIIPGVLPGIRVNLLSVGGSGLLVVQLTATIRV